MAQVPLLLCAVLSFLFIDSALTLGLPWMNYRLGPLANPFFMDLDMMQEHLLNNPEYEQVKNLCDHYSDSDVLSRVHNNDHKTAFIMACEKWQATGKADPVHLQEMQKIATASPYFQEIFNKH